MKPVLVLQHQHQDGPAHLATWLAAQGVATDLRNTEAGQDFPRTLAGHRALAILGGEMSANDPLPSLRRAEDLIREAIARGVPVLGHCLGGQLMARALGAPVTRSPAAEVGWHAIELADVPAARDWFGDARRLLVYQWHFEAFGLPDGATRLGGNAACPNQAFAIGPHLAMQFHVEIDAEKHARWAEDADRHDASLHGVPTVHEGVRIRADGVDALPAQLALAERLYARWLAAAG